MDIYLSAIKGTGCNNKRVFRYERVRKVKKRPYSRGTGVGDLCGEIGFYLFVSQEIGGKSSYNHISPYQEKVANEISIMPCFGRKSLKMFFFSLSLISHPFLFAMITSVSGTCPGFRVPSLL